MKKCVNCARKDIIISAHERVLSASNEVFKAHKDLLDYMFTGTKPKVKGINKRVETVNKLAQKHLNALETLNDFTQKFRN